MPVVTPWGVVEQHYHEHFVGNSLKTLDVGFPIMAESKPTRKQKILKFLAISSVIISLVMSSMALYYTSNIGSLESGVDGETTLSKTGSLYGTHGCETVDSVSRPESIATVVEYWKAKK